MEIRVEIERAKKPNARVHFYLLRETSQRKQHAFLDRKV